MKSLESSKDDILRINHEISEDEDNDIMNRYDVEEKRLSQDYILLRKEKKKRLPLLFYIYIISVLLFLSFFIYFLIQSISKDENYKYIHDKIKKPPLTEYKYSNLTFDNGLQVLLIQIEENDTAGGSIIFDVGNLDNQYQYKNLDIAFSSILNDINTNNNDLEDYHGLFKSSIDEYYSYFSFSILNAGFFKYLESFSKLTYFDDERLKLIQEKVNNTKYSTNQKDINSEVKEKFILEYMVYGCKNLLSENETTIINNRETGEIKEIIDSILQPKRMKIVLGSHFKPSMMKKKFLYYFKNLINYKTKISGERKSNYYNETNFTKKKIICFNIPSTSIDTNYLKINYFIDKDKNEDYYEFIKKLEYFNYIKYILDETNEDSLYYQLTKSSNFTIKSLSCDYEVILENKIKFSIKINLSPSCYYYLEDIIFLTYQYINNLVKFIDKEKGQKSQNSTLEEINIINEQNFTFTEDTNDIKLFTKNLGIKLFQKRNKNNLFKDNWVQPFDFKVANKLFSQLIPNNSVIIIGLFSEAQKRARNNLSYYSFINFTNLFKKNIYIPAYSFSFSFIDLNTEFEKYFKDYDINNIFHENKYISKHKDPIKIDKNEKSHFNFSTDDFYINNSRKITYLKDTRYKLPKVHIVLNIYHPFIRPQKKEKEKENEDKHCIYFEFILYLVFIKREINEKLSDAIRAGNKITIGLTQNNIYINIFAFSDIVVDIISKVKEIIMDNEGMFPKIHDEQFELYMQSALEDYIKIKRIDSNLEKFFLYYSLNPYLYRYNDFPNTLNNINAFNNKCSSIFYEIKNYVTSFIMDCQIYGFFDEYILQNISHFLKETNKDEENYFNASINNAGLNSFNLTINNFKEWITKEKIIIKDKNGLEINSRKFDVHKYRYIFWDKYSIVNRVKSTIYKKILDNLKRYDYITIKFSFFYYNAIYLLIHLKVPNNSDYPEDIYKTIKDKIIEVYKNQSKVYEKKN